MQAVGREPQWVDLRRGDSDDPLACVVRCARQGDRPVDVIVGRSSWQAEAVARAVPAVYLDVALPVLQPADLILLKLDAAGTQDQLDVLLLDGDAREMRIAEVDARVMLLPDEMRQRWSEWRDGGPGRPAARVSECLTGQALPNTGT